MGNRSQIADEWETFDSYLNDLCPVCPTDHVYAVLVVSDVILFSEVKPSVCDRYQGSPVAN